MPQPPAQQTGMTLIEVLVAFVVLSATLAVAMQIFSAGMRNARLAGGYTNAIILAQSQLDTLGREIPIAIGETTGQVGSDTRWTISIQPFDDAGATDLYQMPVRLYRAYVHVAWSEGGKERKVSLSTLKLGPR